LIEISKTKKGEKITWPPRVFCKLDRKHSGVSIDFYTTKRLNYS
jgi:hypothetical protein